MPRTLSFSFCCFSVVVGAIFIGTLAAPTLQSSEMTVGAAFFGLNLKTLKLKQSCRGCFTSQSFLVLN